MNPLNNDPGNLFICKSFGVHSKIHQEYGRVLTKLVGQEELRAIAERSLQNLQHWLKRRRVVAQGPGMFATLEDFK